MGFRGLRVSGYTKPFGLGYKIKIHDLALMMQVEDV